MAFTAVQTLFETTDATYDTGALSFPPLVSAENFLLQVDISSAATVTVYGRLGAGWVWHVISTYTASDADYIPLMPQHRVAITGNNGEVQVGIGYK